MVLFSGLRCPACNTRIALAVAPAGKRFTCPTCHAEMRARRRSSLAAAMMWCPKCWVVPKPLASRRCPRCRGPLEPLHLSFTTRDATRA